MISVVLATHNEEKIIDKSLESVKSFADEIIVVDGDSTDKTPAIAKKYGSKVFSTTNKANFHINKQMAMDKASGELVLQLDADEVVDSELKEFILELEKKLQQMSPSELDEFPKAWWVKRKNLFFNAWLRKGGQYPDPIIRLYRNGFAKLPQKDVHEQMRVQGSVGWAEGHLLHYANPSLSTYFRKFNTYTSFKAHQLIQAKTKHSFGSAFQYLIWKPIITFLSIFFRHKGFVDGMAGFLFALFSSLHHTISYLKFWELTQKEQNDTRFD